MDKITEVETNYEEIFIETPTRFPDVHIYDEHYNEIIDTLFINFDRDGIVKGDQKEIIFSFTTVIKFDTLEYFKKIHRIYYDTELINLLVHDSLGDFRTAGCGIHYPRPLSILEPSDSVISTQNCYYSWAVNPTIPINNMTIFRFDGCFYTTDSLDIFGKTKSFVIHNLN